MSNCFLQLVHHPSLHLAHGHPQQGKGKIVEGEAPGLQQELREANMKQSRMSTEYISSTFSAPISSVLTLLNCCCAIQIHWPFRAESGSPRHFFLANGHF